MSGSLTYGKILKFWFPLSATWLMMSLEGPFLTALIARLSSPEFNLAAYGVAYTVALIIESPVIMMLSASTALVENQRTFIKLRNFTYIINISVTAAMLILLIPPVFNFFAITLVQLPVSVAQLTYFAIAILIPWAPAIGYRRFYQGIMIRNNLTRYVAYGTAIRLTSMGLTAAVLFFFTHAEGVIVGAAALSMGVIIEAAAARVMVVKTLRKLKEEPAHSSKDVSYREIFRFYYPLALTSFISLGFQPVVVFFIGQSRNSLESLAVLPVLNALVFLWRSLGLSIPEVIIALLKGEDEYIKLRNFAAALGLFVIITLGLVTFTPLADLWLLKVSGLSMPLTQFSRIPLILFTFFPALTVWINFQRSVLIYNRDTNPLTMGIIVEVAGMFVSLFITVLWFNWIGIIAAVLSFTLGRLASNFYLIKPFNKGVGILKMKGKIAVI